MSRYSTIVGNSELDSPKRWSDANPRPIRAATVTREIASNAIFYVCDRSEVSRAWTAEVVRVEIMVDWLPK